MFTFSIKKKRGPICAVTYTYPSTLPHLNSQIRADRASRNMEENPHGSCLLGCLAGRQQMLSSILKLQTHLSSVPGPVLGMGSFQYTRPSHETHYVPGIVLQVLLTLTPQCQCPLRLRTPGTSKAMHHTHSPRPPKTELRGKLGLLDS